MKKYCKREFERMSFSWTLIMLSLKHNLVYCPIVFTGIMLMGCSSAPVKSITHINLVTTKTNSLNTLPSKITTRTLSLDRDSLKIGQIKDIAFGDSVCYVLDMNANVFRIPYNVESRSKVINKRGNGPGEYIAPVAIDIYDNDVYVLDIATSSVLKYDENLNSVNSIRLSHPADDIIVFDYGIMASNLDLKTCASPFIIYDFDGKILADLSKNTVNKEPAAYKICTNPFLNIEDSVYALDGNTNKLYVVKDQEIVMKYEFDFGDRAQPKDIVLDVDNYSKYALSTNCFHIGDKAILSYLIENKRMYCFYDKVTGFIWNGSLRETADGFPFFPKWQKDNELVGVLESPDDSENGSLLFYSIDVEK
ncbi:MAG: 6-bladed beta-propeller [Muribaculaceae bacterium]|nr:6-bladed beta-propeller [Muribaculaceae bacterium]